MSKKCFVEGCSRKYYAKSFCEMHYQRVARLGTPDDGPKSHASLIKRFFRKVEKTSGCWLWAGKVERNGYGRIQIGGKGSPQVGAHRVSYEHHKGPIPAGLFVMHKCDNRRCVNPDHLVVGTAKENTRDMILKGRANRTAPKGEAHRSAILCENDVLQIRASDKTRRELSEIYGVHKGTIHGVINRKTWRHI